MGLRIALIDAPPADGWCGPMGLFREAAEALSRRGHDVQTIDFTEAVLRKPDPVVLTALNRAHAARHLIASHRLALQLAERPPDLIIAPLHGGMAQAPLMARACGEAFANTRIVLWGNKPSRNRFLAGDALVSDLGPLIDDAMERQCLALADAVVLPDASSDVPSLPGLARRPPLVVARRIRGAPVLGARCEIREIVFMGAFRRSAGAGEFVEAIEQLSRRGVLGDRLVTFLGPIEDSADGLSKEWLGQKATGWAFNFQVVAETDNAKALAYAGKAGRLAVAISPHDEELDAIRACNRQHVAYRGAPMTDPLLAMRLATTIASALQDAGTSRSSREEVDWLKIVADVSRLAPPVRPLPPQSISVCLLHYNRLALLSQAMASIPEAIDGQEVEVIVLDNASPIADVKQRIEEAAAGRRTLRILPLSEPMPQAAAYNLGLAAARGEVVTFLDDDNMFVPGGLQRLACAVADHDIVVTALDIFDDNHGVPGSSVGRLIFLGAAHSAGLFANLLGDTAMVVRRETFAALGGFHDVGYDYPGFDWVSLAKAQAAGLRIGALQWPAVRYRRDMVRADIRPIKLDMAGTLAFVFEAYRGQFDAPLIARYCQHLQLSDL